MALLKQHKGIGPRFSQATFKAMMENWCLEGLKGEPGQTWIKQHLAIALKEYDATKRR